MVRASLLLPVDPLAGLSAGLLAVCAALGAGAPGAGAPEAGANARVDFARDVLPILSRNCFVCHGPDISTRRAELRLDTFEGATSERGTLGAAIVPGNPRASLLVQRVSSADPDERMPPEAPLGLNALERATLERWIEQGATYARHWSLLPVRGHAPPDAADPRWNAHPVDRFVYAALEQAGLEPVELADRAALARRLSFDLCGLPLSGDEARAFVADDSVGAYERWVDRLLSSPHYGERWARHWLDLVRYAETHGHEFDYPIQHASGYRDYVIRAFNEDVPYYQLVTEHIAGDLLENPRLHPSTGANESILGTGFWFLSPGTHAPTDVRQDEADRIANQIDVLGKAFLATTIACARCHDHKFDPIETAEYYGMAGFLQSSRRDLAYLDPHGEIARASAGLLELRRDEREAFLPDPARTASAAELAAWLTSARDVWHAVQAPTLEDGSEGEALALGAVLAQLDGNVYEKALLARWVRALERTPKGASGHPMATFAELALDSLQPDIADTSAAARERLAASAEAARDGDRIGADFADWFATGQAFASGAVPAGERVVDSDGAWYAAWPLVHSGLASDVLEGTLRSPTFAIESPKILYWMRGRGASIRLVIDGYYLDEHNALLFEGMRFDVDTDGAWVARVQDVSAYIGHRAYIELVDDARAGYLAVAEVAFQDDDNLPGAASPTARATLVGPPEREPIATLAELTALYGRWLADPSATEGPDASAARDVRAWACSEGLLALRTPVRVAELRERRRALEAAVARPGRALALADGSAEDEYVFLRGEHTNVGASAPRRFLRALSHSEPERATNGSGRLALARDLLARENPLPDRVIVNRVWQHLFGRGIVPSADDFGLLGDQPSHPELLDFLALWFRDEAGGSIKALVRWLVQTRTYRLASATFGGQASALDPANALLSHARIRRLEGEPIRDAILAVSGSLERSMFGPPVPIHLTSFMNGRGRPDVSGPLDGAGRRSIYVEVRRNFPVPMMQAFDAPVPMTTIGRRNVSNVPAQALVLMNDPFVHAEAARWAARELERAIPPEQRIERLYWSALGRAPEDSERSAAIELLRGLAGAADDSARAAWVSDLAAWTDLCHALFNLKEFIYLR